MMVDTEHPDAPSAEAFEMADARLAPLAEKLATMCAGCADADEVARMAFEIMSAELAKTLPEGAAAEVAAAVICRVAQRLEAMPEPAGGVA